MAKKMKKLLALFLAVMMVVSTMSVGAFAAELEPSCGVEAHEHTEACYEKVLKCELVKELTCDKGEHQHGEDCYHVHSEACYTLTCTQSTEPEQTCNDAHHKTECLHVCDLACVSVLCALSGTYVCDAEHEGHTDECPKHECTLSCVSARCEETGKVVCEEEHEHTDSCPKHECTLDCVSVLCALSGEIVCEEQHEHEDGCYAAHVHTLAECYDTETELCEKVAGETIECEYEEAHAHEDGCYAAHVHGDACYESKLICEKPVHTHMDFCYLSVMNETDDVDQGGEPETQSSEPITGTITENMTWNDGDVIGGVTIQGNVTITVNGTVTVAGTISMGTDSINTVTIQGGTADATLIRGNDFTGQMFYVEGNSYIFQNLYFNNIVLDGGAVWTGEVDAILNRGTTNSGVKASGSVLYLVRANATLNNCVLQNQDDGTGEKANAVFLREYATIAFNNSVVRNNNSPSGYWKGGVVTTRYGGIVTANNSEVYGNSASHGGFVGIASSGSYGTKVECVNTKIHHNYASVAGGAFYLQDNNGRIFQTLGDNGFGYLKLTGCTLEYNGSPDGLIYSYVYYMPAWIKDTTIANNACAVYTHASENRSFSVAGSTQISSTPDADLYPVPVRIYGALGATASIPMSKASVDHLMNKYGYLATATPDIPHHYNHTGNGSYVVTYEYTCRDLYNITSADLAQVKLYEGNGYTNWVLTDVDGNGMLDAVPVDVEPTTVNVTLIDTFKGANETQTQDVSNVVENVPVCYYEHPGYFFNGWLMEDGTLIKDVNSNVILKGGEKLTATWAVARPRIAISASTTRAREGQPVTLTATISNMDAKLLNYTYQWYRNSTAIEGATDATYTVTEADAGYYSYQCKATATDATYNSDTDYATKTTYGTAQYKENIILQFTEAPAVAMIMETGIQYKSLSAAVADANVLDTATIKMLQSIDFDSTSALEITSDVTIIGAKTISRGDYAGNLFTVAEGASLTLDGGLTIDGGNEWTFDEATYKADRDSRTQVLLADYCTEVDGKLVYKYVTPEAGEPVVADHMILVGAGGIVNLNKVTIKNEYGKNAGVVRSTGIGTRVTLEGAYITHIASMEGNGVVVHSFNADTAVEVVMNAGTLIEGNHIGGNHGLFRLYGNCKMTMNGGEIKNTTGWNSNGVAVSVFGNSEFTMNDGLICGNSSIWGQDNARNMAVNVYAGCTIIMNGGMICHNIGNVYAGGIASYKAASNVIISGGRVVYNVSLGNDERYGAERGDDLDTPGAVSLTGGIFGHDVSEWCAPGYVSLPYDQDMSAYCDLSYVTGSAFANDYNEDTCATDYIVVPGYKVSYYTVETNAETNETTEQFVHEEFLFIPKGKKHDEVDLFAKRYYHLNSEQTQVIKTWYTTNTMDEGTEYDYATEVTANIKLYGAWEDVSTYTVTYVGYYGTVMQTLTTKTGDDVPEYSGWMEPARFPDGNYYYTFSGWTLSEGTLGVDGKVGITDLVYTASFDAHEIEDIFTPFFPTGDDDDTGSNETIINDEPVALAGIPAAFREDHIAYIIGRDDGLVHPNANITRAEVAMIFYRLLNDETRAMYTTTESFFPDVKEDDWFCAAVSTLNAMGIIYGKPDGNFAPNEYITRAEFAAIAARFDPIDPEDADFFTDIDGHWAETEILIAATKGWVEGYNGLFRPDDYISRAEAMTMVNRVLLRNPESVEDLLDNMIVWTDNMDTEKWYYLAVQEATNSHDYARKESGNEYWVALTNEEK